jgi:photosystem II stability/assembly factor-like uncharacterized protein
MRTAPLIFAAFVACAQEATPPGTPPGTPPPPAAPAPLVYSSKSITLPFHCTEEDIQWAGLTCSEDEPCQMFLELTSAEGAGTKLFAAGNIHSTKVTLYSVLLASDDGGHSWLEAGERVRGAALDHIQVADADTAWVVGETVYPLPQDPFLLLTTDGGKTWRNRPVFSETHYGTVQQIYFNGKVNGSLVIDRGAGADGGRYELYESPDGGENWLIKEETTKPIKLRHTPPPSDWRVRADGPTHSFHIEHRAGDRWTTAAAFSVALPACGAK